MRKKSNIFFLVASGLLTAVAIVFLEKTWREEYTLIPCFLALIGLPLCFISASMEP